MTFFYKNTLGEILDKLPQTVRTLSLKEANIVADQEKESLKGCSNISNLKLYYLNIKGKDFSSHLIHYFPKLTSLILYYCNFEYDYITKDRTDTIELPDHQLEYVEFTPDQYSTCYTRNLIHFTVTASGQSRYYEVPKLNINAYYLFEKITVDNKDHSIQRALKESPLIDNNLKSFHFKCASVNTFYCSGYLLLL